MPGRAGMQAHAGRQPWHAGSSSGQIAWRQTRTHTRAGRAATGTLSYGIGPGELQSAWDLRGRNTSCAETWAQSGVHAGAQFSKRAQGVCARREAGEKQKTQVRLQRRQSGGAHRHRSKRRSPRCQQHKPDRSRDSGTWESSSHVPTAPSEHGVFLDPLMDTTNFVRGIEVLNYYKVCNSSCSNKHTHLTRKS